MTAEQQQKNERKEPNGTVKKTDRQTLCTYCSLSLVFTPSLFEFLHFPSLHAVQLHAQRLPLLNTPTPVPSLYFSSVRIYIPSRRVLSRRSRTQLPTAGCKFQPSTFFHVQCKLSQCGIQRQKAGGNSISSSSSGGGGGGGVGGWEKAVIWWIPQRDSFHLLHFALSPIPPLWCPILIFSPSFSCWFPFSDGWHPTQL